MVRLLAIHVRAVTMFVLMITLDAMGQYVHVYQGISIMALYVVRLCIFMVFQDSGNTYMWYVPEL